jgi:Helix-turn-helix
VPTSIYNVRYASLRAALTAARKEAGLTQVELAERLGLGQPYVSKVERGETYIDLMLWVEWVQACGQVPGRYLDQSISGFPQFGA